jgi:flavin-dependent dehydrogenase
VRQIAVVGGGPAGSAVAAVAARRGRDVVLFERDAFPRSKLCGEFLSPEAQGLLDRIGCLAEVRAAGAVEIMRARFTAPSGARIEIPLPAPAIGVSRRALDAILFDAARRAGAEGVERAEVRSIGRPGAFRLDVLRDRDRAETCDAEVVLAAYGRRTRIDVEMGRGFTNERHPFVAFERHHRASGSRIERELAGSVEIHTVDGGYCGMSHVEGGVVNVCMLLEQRFVDVVGGADWGAILSALGRSNAALGARLAELEPVDGEPLAVAEIPFGRRELAKDGVVFLGDAAGMIAPMLGDGQAMALESAVLLAGLLDALPKSASHEDVDRLGRRWARAWRLRFEVRIGLGRILQNLSFVPEHADRMIRTVRGIPGLPALLARWTRGSARGYS